jgi:protein-S-isoprenylcysteine O-methyltransferase Ste14
MYVGFTLLLLGFAVYLATPLLLLGPFVFIAYTRRFQIVPEERIMAAKFGKAYSDYCARVRRWP